MTTIRHKRSAVSGAIPNALTLVAGELAINSADGRVFLKDDAGNVREIGPTFSLATEAAFDATTIPATVNSISIRGYWAEGDAGAHIKRRVAAPEVANDAQKTKADGSRWEIVAQTFRLEHFGAKADGSFTTNEHTAGTDNSTAVTKAISAAAFLKRPIELLGCYRTSAASCILSSKVRIEGKGPTTGFVIPVYAADSGIWDKAGSWLTNFRVHVCTMEAKLANSGHLQACVMVTANGYFFPSPTVDAVGVSGFVHTRLTLTRRSVGGGGGSGWFGIGHVHHGFVADCDDAGSTANHSNLISLHWAGQGAGYGSTVNKTWHPHDIFFGAMTGTKSNVGVAISSSYNITQKGPLDFTGAINSLYLLPGDETDTLADTTVHPVGSIGKGIDIQGPIFHRSPAGSERAVVMFSQGTSALGWRSMPGNPSVGFMSDLDMDVKIGNVTVYDATAANQGALEANYMRGILRVGTLKLVNSAAVIGIADIFHSQDCSVEIEKISGTCRYRLLRAVEVSNIKVGEVEGTALENDTSTKAANYIFGDQYTATVSGAHSANATTLNFTAGISTRMSRNTPIVVGGATVYTTGYNPPGMTSISVTPLPALAGGETATMVHKCRNVDIKFNTTGGYMGADVSMTEGVLRGTIKRATIFGLRPRINSLLALDAMQFVATGYGNGTPPSYDITIAAADGTQVVSRGSVFGIDAQASLTYCIACSTADGTVRRYIGMGDRFAGYATGPVVASSANNYSLIGCVDKNKALIP